MDYEKELRKITRRHDERMLEISTVPPFGRYLFAPITLALGGLAGWLAGRDIGRIEVWAALIAGTFLFSFGIHWLGHKVGRAWIAYKYGQYDSAASLAEESAARARHDRVEAAMAVLVIGAIMMFLAFMVWTDAVQPLLSKISAWF